MNHQNIKNRENFSDEESKKADSFILKIIFMNFILISTFGGVAYNNYLFGFINGSVLFIYSFILYKFYKGSVVFRLLAGVILTIFTMVLVQQNFGSIEMHFSYFILLAFLTIYKDYKPLLLASFTIILQHFIFTYLQLNEFSFFGVDIIIYNYGCSYNIAFIHGLFVIAETVVLYLIIKRDIEKSEKIELYQDKLLQNSLNIIDNNLISLRVDLHGDIIDASEKFCQLSKYPKAELIGKNHIFNRALDNPKELLQDLQKAMKEGKSWSEKIKNIDKNKKAYWVLSNMFPEYDSDNRLIGYIFIKHNITNEKEIEKLLEQVKEQNKIIEKQSKFSAMGDMVSMIAHQWRQPLTTLGIILNKLDIKREMKILSDSDLEDSLGKTQNLIQHMSKTIEDFRTFFKDDTHKESISLKEQIQKSKELIEPSLKIHHITFIENYEVDENIMLNIYSSKLTQVLINLYKNAYDELLTRNIENPMISLTCRVYKSNLILEINDNAGGISEDICDKIFEPYFSTKSKNGTGIGLYMSKMIVENQLKGMIIVSNNHQGAIFNIKIPLN